MRLRIQRREFIILFGAHRVLKVFPARPGLAPRGGRPTCDTVRAVRWTTGGAGTRSPSSQH